MLKKAFLGFVFAFLILNVEIGASVSISLPCVSFNTCMLLSCPSNEYVCKDGNSYQFQFTCALGACMSYTCPLQQTCTNGCNSATGLCNPAPTPTPTPCSDPDGEDAYTYGTCVPATGKICLDGRAICNDYCSGYGDEVHEQICHPSGGCDSKLIVCNTGDKCVAGKCVPATPCTDSDGGKNYNIQGTCKDSGSCSGAGCTDSCVSTYGLKEYYCSSNSCASETITCSGGAQCLYGACELLAPTPTPTATPTATSTPTGGCAYWAANFGVCASGCPSETWDQKWTCCLTSGASSGCSGDSRPACAGWNPAIGETPCCTSDGYRTCNSDEVCNTATGYCDSICNGAYPKDGEPYCSKCAHCTDGLLNCGELSVDRCGDACLIPQDQTCDTSPYFGGYTCSSYGQSRCDNFCGASKYGTTLISTTCTGLKSCASLEYACVYSCAVKVYGHNPASCDDGVQNCGETGVDCGGSSCPSGREGGIVDSSYQVYPVWMTGDTTDPNFPNAVGVPYIEFVAWNFATEIDIYLYLDGQVICTIPKGTPENPHFLCPFSASILRDGVVTIDPRAYGTWYWGSKQMYLGFSYSSRPAECSDGKDNDHDCSKDCGEPDCAGVPGSGCSEVTPTPTPTSTTTPAPTPIPTSTSTSTPIPTSTSTPTPTPVTSCTVPQHQNYDDNGIVTCAAIGGTCASSTCTGGCSVAPNYYDEDCTAQCDFAVCPATPTPTPVGCAGKLCKNGVTYYSDWDCWSVPGTCTCGDGSSGACCFACAGDGNDIAYSDSTCTNVVDTPPTVSPSISSGSTTGSIVIGQPNTLHATITDSQGNIGTVTPCISGACSVATPMSCTGNGYSKTCTYDFTPDPQTYCPQKTAWLGAYASNSNCEGGAMTFISTGFAFADGGDYVSHANTFLATVTDPNGVCGTPTPTSSATCANAFAGAICDGHLGETLACGCRVFTCK